MIAEWLSLRIDANLKKLECEVRCENCVVSYLAVKIIEAMWSDCVKMRTVIREATAKISGKYVQTMYN